MEPVKGLTHHSLDSGFYAAAYMLSGQKAGIQADVELKEDRAIKFRYYEATNGLQIKGCCDTNRNCPFASNKDITIRDKRWKNGSFFCPAGTSKVRICLQASLEFGIFLLIALAFDLI